MTIEPHKVEKYLQSHGYPSAELIALVPLGGDLQEGLKGHGYGRPLRARFIHNHESKDVVIRTIAPDPFGHDRRSDRMDGMVQAYDYFNLLPRHIRSLDLGVVTKTGELRSIAQGEPFLLTDYVEGDLYAHDLSLAARRPTANQRDISRAKVLASYLATLHQQRVPEQRYVRAIRDLVGHGEGIMGLVDSYEPSDSVATESRLFGIERLVLNWRWKLKNMPERARRTHGDFHPFNILFREDADFSVLDASRGLAGEPADDVTALSINYLFFALAENGRFSGALRELWNVFWSHYLEASHDRALLSVVAPFFAWRALVLACPAWYPNLVPATRDRILSFAERLLLGARFTPDRIDELIEPQRVLDKTHGKAC